MRRRIVITGVGCVTPLGNSVDELWTRLLRGESGVGPTTRFDATNFPTRISAEVKDFSVAEIGEEPDRWKYRSRHTHFAAGAATQAVAQAGIDEHSVDPTRFGVYVGTGEGPQDFGHFTRTMNVCVNGGNFDVAEFSRRGFELLHPIAELEQEPNMPPAHLACMFNAQGPNLNCLTACAASSQAIGEGAELIRRGLADVMLTGGAHSMIHPFGVTGFNLLTALSTRNAEPTRASRPFDRDRDGFVLGEGAAMLIIEDYDHARRRGAEILGELLGYGTTADAYRVTDAHPEGRDAARCMRMALEDASLNLDDIAYINAHGTSTDVNDRVETHAVKTVFGEQAYKIPVSSTKSMTGHLIAAAGATETVICLQAVRNNVLPPTINYENPDPNCDLDYVPNKAREANCRYALSNSFGFGGQNVALVVGRFDA
jgi:3-oxoacyl-[acyl-carrier-protein] synthase II